MKRILSLPALLLFFGIQFASAQNDLDLFIEDMLRVADAYASPGAEGAALQSSAGWFTSAKDMDKWQFEISLHGNALFIPSSEQTTSFKAGEIVKIAGKSPAVIPTVYGGATNVVFEGELEFLGQNVEFNFDAIDGLDKDVLVHPFVQATLGLPYGTDVAVRFLPRIVYDDVGFSTYGIGLKHNFNQYFKFSRPDDFQFSAVITYSNFELDYAFSPVSIPSFLELDRIDVDADLWLFQILGSKLYGDFEVFGALGVASSDFDFTMGGSGAALGLLNDSLGGFDGSENKFKGDLGFNYYIGKFKFSSMFTASSFFNYNLGLHYRI